MVRTRVLPLVSNRPVFPSGGTVCRGLCSSVGSLHDEVSNFDRRMEGFRLPLLGNRTGNCLRRVGGRLEVRHSSTDRIMSDPQRDAHESIGVV